MSKLLGVNVERATATAEHELGLVVRDVRGGEGGGSLSFVEIVDGATTTRRFYPDGAYQYIKAGSAISAGNAVTADLTASNEPYTVVPTSAAAQVLAGIAETAIASAYYGWIKIKGRVNAAVNTGTLSAGSKLVSGSTAGALGALASDSNITTSSNLLALVALTMGAKALALDSNDSNAATVEVLLTQ